MTTSRIGLSTQAHGTPNWDGPVRSDAQIVDDILAGANTKSLTGGTVTLTLAEAQCRVLILSGTLTSDATVTLPRSGAWSILNATAGPFTVTVRGSAGDTGSIIERNATPLIVSDGTRARPSGPFGRVVIAPSLPTGIPGDSDIWITIESSPSTVTESASAADTSDASLAGFSDEAQQFFDRITDPGETRKTHYATLIDALVIAGVWAKLDSLHVMAANTAANSRINLKSSSYALLDDEGSPEFMTDRGWLPLTSPGNYGLDTQLSLTAGGLHASQNSLHAMAWSLGGDPVKDFMHLSNGSSSGLLQLNADEYGTAVARLNQNANQVTGAGGTGMVVGNRSGVNDTQVYRNGTSVGSATNTTSTTPISGTIRLGRTAGTGNMRKDRLAAASIGASLTSGEVTAFYNALRTYMTAVGVP